MDVKERVRREDKIAVMFSTEMKARLDKIAAGFGMPPSTLCAFAVASWVQQQETNAAMTRMAVLSIAKQAGEKLDGLDLDELVRASVFAGAKSVGDPLGLMPTHPPVAQEAPQKAA